MIHINYESVDIKQAFELTAYTYVDNIYKATAIRMCQI